MSSIRELPPPPTVRDIAKVAGVSLATVSYVLNGRRNGKDRISDPTRQRIIDAGAALGYVPNQTARSLRRQRTERVCLVLGSLGVPYDDYLAHELHRVADANGYSVMIAVGGSDKREQHILDQLRQRFADGAIFTAAEHITGRDLAQLADKNLAIVVASNRINGAGFDIVRTTEQQACYQAVKYLLDKGHRRIAFLGHSGSQTSRLERMNSYRRALKNHKVAMDEKLIVIGENTREDAYHNTTALLQPGLTARPTAIFAASDLAAISAIWAIRDAGLHIPEDIAVIGVGNLPEGEITRPALTTVGPKTLDFSTYSQLLFSRLLGEAPADGRVIEQPWELIQRGSA